MRENDGKTSGERGKRRRETEVDGGKQRQTAADLDGGGLRRKKAVCW